MHDETPDLFHVRLANGELRVLTLEQLDDAFQARWIDERTPVLRAGEASWSTLGRIAGLDETPSPVSVAPVALDAGSDRALDTGEIPPELRPRSRGRIFGVALAVAVVGAVGFTAVRAGPSLAGPISARLAKLRATEAAPASEGPKAAAAMAPTPPAAAPPARAVDAAPRAAPLPAPAPAPAPAAAAQQAAARATPGVISPTIPTIAASALPNAKPAPARRSRR